MTYRCEWKAERSALAARIATAKSAQDEKALRRVAESRHDGEVPLTKLRERVLFLLGQDEQRVVELDAAIKRVEELKSPPPPMAEIASAVKELRRRLYTWPTHAELEHEMGRALPGGVLAAYVNSATTSTRFVN